MSVVSSARPSLIVSAIILMMVSRSVMPDAPYSSREPSHELLVLEHDGRYTIRASHVPLPTVLRELSVAGGVDIRTDSRLDDVLVNLRLLDVTLQEAIAAVSGSHAEILEKRGSEYETVSVLITAEVDPVSFEDSVSESVGTTPDLRAEERAHRVGRDDRRHLIMLQNAVLDTRETVMTGRSFPIPKAFEAAPDTRHHIVQFDRALDQNIRNALTDAGAVISHYIPQSAYAVRVDPNKLDRIRALPSVQHIEPYHPYFKMSADIHSYLAGNPNDSVAAERARQGQYNLVFFRGADAKSFMDRDDVEIVSRTQSDGRDIITVSASPDLLPTLLRADDVQWMEPTPRFEPMNDLAVRRIGAPSLRASHPYLDGSGVTVNVTDTGIDFTNPNFAVDPTLPTSTNYNTRIRHYAYAPSLTSDGLPGDRDGHGTHVAGSILGNGWLSADVSRAPGSLPGGQGPYEPRQFGGVAPGADVVVIEDFNSFTAAEQAETAYTQGARISNNSWGANVFEYGVSSMLWDGLTRDALPGQPGNQEYTVLFAAGNSGNGAYDGSGGIPGTVGQPGNAKNVISVGAVEQKRFADNLLNVDVIIDGQTAFTIQSDQQTDTDWQVAYFSGRGPVSGADRRIKPDIVAPGSYVLSVQSHETPWFDVMQGNPPILNSDYQYGNVDSGTNFAFFSGTSMATPVAAGAAALFYQRFTNLYARAPSPAMVKAAMVGGSRMLNSIAYKFPPHPSDVQRVDQGWGLLDIRRAVDGVGARPTDEIFFWDQTDITPLQTGQHYDRHITVGPDEGGLKIVLAWTDVPGTPGNAMQLVNDLDLIVLAPDGGGYLGNRFLGDGAHSEKLANPDPSQGDGYNNVEVVVIPEPAPGVYTVRVRGWEVPQGPQDFALAVIKGIGVENRHEGGQPAMDVDADGNPVIAFSTLVGLNRQIHVKRWIGELGDRSLENQWMKMEGQWFSVAGSALGTGISQTLADSTYPAVAADGERIMVAWQEEPQSPQTQSRIYFKLYNGSEWIEPDNSARHDGVSGPSPYDATNPMVAVRTNGNPVVAWVRHVNAASNRVFVAEWNGEAWIGLGHSLSNGLSFDGLVYQPRMIVDALNRPTITVSTQNRIRTLRWNGVSWQSLEALGAGHSATQPYTASTDDGRLLVAWIHQMSPGAGYGPYQVYAAIGTGPHAVTFTDLGGSRTYPGVSAATNTAWDLPRRPAIAGSSEQDVIVSWIAGLTTAVNTNSVRVAQYNGASWNAYGNAAAYPGIDRLIGAHHHLELRRKMFGIPVLAFANEYGAHTETLVYSMAADVSPPLFEGLRDAVGGTNGNVRLTWLPATDRFSTNIAYHIYRSPDSAPCWEVPNCMPESVFDTAPIAIVTNVTSFEALGLAPYWQHCYGVRAADESGRMDDNMVVHFAAPKALDTEGQPIDCYAMDTDGDGMPDWWEYLHFGSATGGDAGAVMNPHGGLTNLHAFIWGTDPFSADSDGDGLTDAEEVYVYGTHPAIPDTDGDGIPDGMEVALGSDPRHWDSNTNHVRDGHTFQLGNDNPADPTAAGYHILLAENFENGAPGWIKPTGNTMNFWHLSTAEPAPLSTVITSFTYTAAGARVTNTVEWLHGPPHTPNRRTPDASYRFANDPAANNPAATYWAYPPAPLDAALQSPPVDASGAASLFLRWKEFHDTEPNKDFIHVQARSAAQPNWITVAEPRSGNSKDWLNRRVNLSQFAGDVGVEIRFRFTADQYNQALFTGWYVDDVIIYEAARIEGWVRDINGRPVVGATVQALGRGGVTNIVDGHQVVNPPAIFASTKTGADGGFLLVDLPQGRYYVKAQAPGYRSEFYNGPLFTPPYAFGAGVGMNPGVFTLREVNDALGYLDLTAPGAAATVHFELEPGDNRSLLGVAHHEPLPVFINNDPVTVWNGANQPGVAGFEPYLALPTLDDLEDLMPDWTHNPVRPRLFGALMEGDHRVGFGPDHWRRTHPRVPVREGEITRVHMVDSVAEGYIQVVSGDGLHYPIYLNGNPTGQETPALFKAQAGRHRIHLAPNHDDDVGVPPKEIVVPIGGRINVRFTTGQLTGPVGALDVRAVDELGAAIEGAVIRINGVEIPPGQALSDDPLTPAIVGWLRDGLHEVTVHREGYRKPESRTVRVNPGHIGFIQFAMTQSDQDHDGVGDATEIRAFGDIWSESSDGDPDGDGLSNLIEFEMFRLYGIVLDPSNPDTDGDGMSDSEEIGFNGFTRVGNHPMFALTKLATPAQAGDAQVSILFRGRYLDGIDNFGKTNTGHVVTQVVASIAGDRFVATNIVHPPLPAVPTAQSARTILTGIPSASGTAPVSRSVSDTHAAGAPVFADTMPHIRDTSGDGMWDGFKHAHARMGPNFGNLLILCPLEHGGAHDDPDGDGLTNLQEFQVGTHPGNPDTDGDGMPDGWEVFYGLNPLDPGDALEDPSGSGLTNWEEYYYGTNPLKADTDGDGLKDGEEVFGTLNPWKEDAFFPEFPGSTDPLNPDTDGDGLLDGLEILLGTNPNRWDTSGDGLSDGFCVLDPFGNLRPQHLRLNPLDPLEGARDASGDGMSNLENFLVRDGLGHFGQPPPGIVWDYWLDPFSTDSDGDGMPDVFEVHYGLHPMDPVPVDDGLLTRHMDVSARGDLDSDGLWNLLEYRIRFLLDPDADPYDLALGTDPRNPDTDGDGLNDGEEWLALLSNPTKQDTDGDGLPDGSAGAVPGEVESTVRRHYELVPAPPGTTWWDAFVMAMAKTSPHSQSATGRLATVVHQMEQDALKALLTPDVTRAAIGGRAIPNTNSAWLTAPEPRRHTPEWASSGQPYLRGSGSRGRYEHFEEGQPLLPESQQVYGFVMGADGKWSAIPDTDEVSHYLVEWNHVQMDTNHYDQAENDLWRLMYPLDNGKGLPYWERITPAVEETGYPPPRWGHASVYVPVFEKKHPIPTLFPRIAAGGIVLLDNRKIVVMGGRDGVSRHRDIWEYWIHDNTWRRSARDFVDGAAEVLNAQNMDSGLSEFNAVLLLGHSETSVCPVPPGVNPYGDGFKEPVYRPWGPKERWGVPTGLRLWDTDFGDPQHHLYQQGSYDIAYVLGGWNERNQFAWNEPLDTLYYKSTDDPRPITESVSASENAVDYFQYAPAVQEDGSVVVSTEHIAQTVPLPLGRVEMITELELQNGDVISRTYTNLNVPVGIRFNRFPFGSCEAIESSVLSFQVTGAAENMAAYIVAEKNEDGISPANYLARNETDNLIQTPSQRRHWPHTSTNVAPFTIPAHFNGHMTVNVTDLVREAVHYPWEAVSIGFVIYTDMDQTEDRQAQIVPGSAAITVSYVPSYKVQAEWRVGDLYQTGQDYQAPSRRKSFAMVYDYHEDRIVVFGGMDGLNVYNDTYLGQPRFWDTRVNDAGDYVNIGVEDPEPDVRTPRYVRWKNVDTQAKPAPRWGHSMVYDDINRRVVLFGGFDERNRPLNDLWTFNTVDRIWQQITDFQDGQRPPPRGGAAMVFHGGAYYQRGFSPETYEYVHRGRIVLFGGTDGRRYFNDTWVFDHHYDQLEGVIETGSSNRWIMAVPGGEHAQAPSPRAFATMVFGQNAAGSPDPYGASTFAYSPGLRRAVGAVYLFGGRTGLLPSSRDTSGDLVEDGVAHAIGRDPRINTLIHKDTDQTPAFGYVRIGSHGGNMPVERAAVADFEVLSYLDRLHGWRHWSYTGTPIPYQGHPLMTTIANEEFKIGDEEDWPVEDPDPVRTYYIVGVDAITPSWTNLWYHRARGGMRGDEGDGWQLGIPDSTALGASGAPPTAYAGRWVYGTNLKGPYPNNAVMDLYSPIINLSLPSPQGTAPDSTNTYHLLFYEWLDLADPNDKVVVEAIRPTTPADVQTRQSGAGRPPIVVVPERGYTANTTGQWRRVAVSLDAVGQDPQVYLRFSLSSDASGNAGGWYIDNVAILQGGRIADTFEQAALDDPVSLRGVRSEMLVAGSTIYDGGAFVFDMLPSGEYIVQSGSEIYGPIVIDPNNPDPDLDPDFLLLRLELNSDVAIVWESIEGRTYRIEYTDTLNHPQQWTPLGANVTATNNLVTYYVEGSAAATRFYRVWLLSE